ncbi:CoA transferase [Galactobacter valiniphilus]|uniref:CoA transferase n=1 Tax=Galactobacter valiniphilus TaxID=2676122 RepID=A0A399J952_9MICC|nr:CoA transferase [Galactobacter valiniphilus]RII41057.1 CoA transferase [Galactobacter valiniphilus]
MPLPAPASQHRPLEGLIVADFSRILAGPLATMTLADLGARVIKVERPGAGDDTRSWGPPFSEAGQATYFESVNRNKESLELDLADPADREVARALALRADVLVENFKVGGLDKLGLGYEELSAAHPGLVYASISGFGDREGASLAGYDFVVQALGGLMDVTGEAGGEAMKSGVALVDVLTAKDATIAILAALRARESTGRGSHVKVNLLSSLQGALVNQGQAYLGAGVLPTRKGNVHPSIAPYQSLRCADAPLAVACGNDGQFKRLCAELGLAGLEADERFATNPARVRHREELEVLLEGGLASDTAACWQERLTAVGVPAGKVATIAEGVEYARELGLEPELVVHDDAGAPVGRQFRHPATWVPAFEAPAAAPPALGAHSDAVRAWLEAGA